MKRIIKHIIQPVVLLIFITSQAYAGEIKSPNKMDVIDELNITNGLSNNGVSAIFEDSRGYIWVASYDGLNRYNGHSVTTFKNSRSEVILPTNRIRTINEDSLGRLWIGTDDGIVIYDYDTHSFIIEDAFKEGGIIRDIILDGDLIYCISENTGVIVYDMSLNLVRHDKALDMSKLSNAQLFGDRILIAVMGGVVEYDIESHLFSLHSFGEQIEAHEILFVAENRAIVATNNGLFDTEIIASDGKCDILLQDVYRKDLNIKSVFRDRDGGLWIGTVFEGLIYIPNRDNPSIQYDYLPKNRISDFVQTSSGDIWVSTFDNGLFRLTEHKEIFKTPAETKSLAMPVMRLLDGDRVIIKSKRDVYIYNLKEDKYEQTPRSMRQFFSSVGGYVLVDRDKKIWSISATGCYIYDIDSGVATKLEDPKLLTLRTTIPTDVVQDHNGDIWVGYDNNLFRISFNQDRLIKRVESIYRNDFFKESSSIKVKTLVTDALTNSIWVGTARDGLYVIDLDNSDNLSNVLVSNYRHNIDDATSISSNFVSSIIRDNRGVIWVGTEQGGLCRATEDGETLKFTPFTEQDGLSNDVVKSIECDDLGRLWIATNVGLSSFDTETQKFRTFRKTDGLPFEEFLYSSIISSSGKIALTGSTEFCYFDPIYTPNNEKLPKLYFSGLKIYDNQVIPNKPFDGDVIIRDQLSSGDSFSLAHDQNSFSIGIDAIYDQRNSYHHYHYRLDPINSEWITTHASNDKITFNGLSPGQYTLRVKASSSFGEMTPEQEIYIRIKRPLYASIGAWVLYIILISMVILWIFYSMMRNQKLNYRLTLEAQEKESLRQNNIEKQRYFSNISHELKTPLTLIMAPLSILSDKFQLDRNIKGNLAIMQRQVRRMLQLIDLAHGIQLSDESCLELKAERFIVRDFLKEISADFDFLATFDKKSFKVEYPASVLSVNADRNMMEKVLNNLLNNAFKYTTAGDEITVSYRAEGDILTLVVSDNGFGISADDLPRIFERFYTSKSIETKKVGGTGIGLAFSKYLVELHGGTIVVESEYGRGTSFIVKMPIIVDQESIDSYIDTDEVVDEKDIILGSLDLDSSIEVDPQLRERVVYVVEDNGEMRAFIAQVVGRYFRVEQYASATECLSAMESQWPDIIVSDVMMPDMDGDKMCEIIKSDIRTSHIPIILLTARYTVDDKIKGIELGADSYIGKPFYPKHLITRISALLKGRQKLYEHFQKGLPFKQANSGSGISSRDSELLSSLYELIDNSLDDDMVELDTFALKLGLNRSTFYSKIKALTDMSPYELMKNYRLQKAKELLESGEHNVNEVCDMTGFKSRTHFSRVFKQHFGVAPSKVPPKSK